MLIVELFTSPLRGLMWVIAILTAITIHEFSHAFAAYKLGDYTAKDEGRLTLNPLKHLDFAGTILLFLAGFGWGKPVPVNYYNLKKQKWGPAIVSVAGPLSNIILASILGIVLKIVYEYANIGPDRPIFILISILIFINLTLAVFNLIPIPPLDGSKILFTLIPDRFASFKLGFERYGFFVLLMLVFFAGNLFSYGFAYLVIFVEWLFGFPWGIFAAALF